MTTPQITLSQAAEVCMKNWKTVAFFVSIIVASTVFFIGTQSRLLAAEDRIAKQSEEGVKRDEAIIRMAVAVEKNTATLRGINDQLAMLLQFTLHIDVSDINKWRRLRHSPLLDSIGMPIPGTIWLDLESLPKRGIRLRATYSDSGLVVEEVVLWPKEESTG